MIRVEEGAREKEAGQWRSAGKDIVDVGRPRKRYDQGSS